MHMYTLWLDYSSKFEVDTLEAVGTTGSVHDYAVAMTGRFLRVVRLHLDGAAALRHDFRTVEYRADVYITGGFRNCSY